MTIQQYIDQVNTHFCNGNATEHTYRGSLQFLLKSLLPTVSVTNEPKRIACGAPDYILMKKDIPVGYIGAIKHVKITQLPKVNDTIHTFIETKNKIGNASIVEGKIFLQKNCIASCELTIFVQQNESL